MIVYKVLRKGNYSAWAGGKAIVRYKIDEWRRAPAWLEEKGYYMLAFDYKFNAIRFANSIGVKSKTPRQAILSEMIYMAQARGITAYDKLPPMLNMESVAKGEMDGSSIICGWPHGTIMCAEIKLLKKINEYYKKLKEA